MEKNKTTTRTPVTFTSCYHCIECLTPSTTLYRQYTASVSSIKLTPCVTCCNGSGDTDTTNNNIGQNHNVDDYIEREWLLVLFDCLLLRLPAYRHVLFNRLDLMEKNTNDRQEQFTSQDDKKTTNDNTSFSSRTIKNGYVNWYYWVCASVAIDVWLKWQTLLVTSSTNTTCTTSSTDTTTCMAGNDDAMITNHWMNDCILLVQFVMGSILSLVCFWFGIYQTTKIFLLFHAGNAGDHTTKDNHHHNKKNGTIPTISSVSLSVFSQRLLQLRLGVSVVFPTMFHIVTLLVFVWEDSPIVQWLSSFFVLVLQYTAMSTTIVGSLVQQQQQLREEETDNHTKKYRRKIRGTNNVHSKSSSTTKLMTFKIFILFVMGVFMKACVPILMNKFILPSTIVYPCTGLAIRQPIGIPPTTNTHRWWTLLGSSLVSSHESQKQPLLLCIT